MQTPLRVTYRNLASSEALNHRIAEEAAKLETFFERIVSCRVVVEMPHRHHRQGRHFRVRVDLVVPGEELTVGRDPAEHKAHEDPLLAVSEAFRAMTRKLQDHVRKASLRVKQHEDPARGQVARLDSERGFGFLRTPEGREIYFHEKSVLNHGFGQLKVGSWVRFVEEAGEKGPQASTVVPA